MKVLGFTAQSRLIPSVLLGIHSLEFDGLLHWHFARGGDIAGQKSESCYHKAIEARQIALNGGYDALLIVDDDTLIQPDTLRRLAAHEADIAYALYIRRDSGHYWTASHRIDERALEPYQARVDMCEAWGKTIEVAGVGTGCTLIRRPVLETIPFSRRGVFGYDWYLAVDAVKGGFRQVCDTSIPVGHVDLSENVIYWPTPDGYRIESYQHP